MTRLAAVTGWILVWGALTGAAYWAFLITPESTVWALLLSALLAIVSLALLAVTVNGAIVAWSSGVSRGTLRPAIRHLPRLLPGVVVVAIAWWLVGRATGWVSAHSGEISAWFIVRFGWSDVSALFAAVNWTGWWIRWILAPMIALSFLAGPIRRGVSPLRLLMATVWFLLLVAAPWVYLAPWRPAALPPTSVEPLFIALKLAVTAVLMATGLAFITREASRV
jgi:hypothetical protein